MEAKGPEKVIVWKKERERSEELESFRSYPLIWQIFNSKAFGQSLRRKGFWLEFFNGFRMALFPKTAPNKYPDIRVPSTEESIHGDWERIGRDLHCAMKKVEESYNQALKTK